MAGPIGLDRPEQKRYSLESGGQRKVSSVKFVNNGDVALTPNEAADPASLVDAKIPEDITSVYEIHSYRNAAVILSEGHKNEFNDLLDMLRSFRITTEMIRKPGGNESDIPKCVSRFLRPRGWHETVIQGDLLVRLRWKEPAKQSGSVKNVSKERRLTRPRYLDGHKIDYVKGKVAFDLEWNSKDQTYDRDLYAMSAFAQCGVVDVGVILTRSATLNPIFKELGCSQKYGASTTWMGKLLYRLNAGRNGACPVLAIGITPAVVSDWEA